MVDEDWWMGQNAQGQTGLFPSNYVELVEGDDEDAPPPAAPPAIMEQTPSAPAAGPPGGTHAGPTATALYDYEAAGKQNKSNYPARQGLNQALTFR